MLQNLQPYTNRSQNSINPRSHRRMPKLEQQNIPHPLRPSRKTTHEKSRAPPRNTINQLLHSQTLQTIPRPTQTILRNRPPNQQNRRISKSNQEPRTSQLRQQSHQRLLTSQRNRTSKHMPTHMIIVAGPHQMHTANKILSYSKTYLQLFSGQSFNRSQSINSI